MDESLLFSHERDDAADPTDRDTTLAVDELLEDVSIDGMCGVY